MAKLLKQVTEAVASFLANPRRLSKHSAVFCGICLGTELKSLMDVLTSSSQNYESDLVKHNLVVFRNGESALQVLPPLLDIIPESRLNLVIWHLKMGEVMEAYDLVKDLEPSTPQVTLFSVTTQCRNRLSIPIRFGSLLL